MVSCKICGYETDKTIQQHIKFKHNIPVSEYYDKYPGSSVYSDEYSEYLRKRINERDPSYKKKLSESTKRLYQNKEWVEKHNRALKEKALSYIIRKGQKKIAGHIKKELWIAGKIKI